MEEYIHELKIPQKRIAVLIGTKGSTKHKIEKLTETRIDVDSEYGNVSIKGEDSIKLYTTRKIVKAIGRGFNPEKALQLLKSDYSFDLIRITDYVDKKSHIHRLKGRVIGADGKARRTIEELTKTDICVYGKTVGIIGRIENVSLARRAVQALLQGSMHATVFKRLERQKRRRI